MRAGKPPLPRREEKHLPTGWVEVFHAIRTTWLAILVIGLLASFAWSAVFGVDDRLPHEKTMVCKDGTELAPGYHRGTCEPHGGFERYE
jgi:hypothetical protein